MKKVLFITTSADKINEEWPSGIWFEELSTPYYILKDGGVEVDIASPKGGNVPCDPKAFEDEHITESVERFRKDQEAAMKLGNSKVLSQADFNQYDAIFFPGGHGAIMDLPEDQTIKSELGEFFDSGKIVAAICHGPAGLVSAKKGDGKALVEGRRVTCFSNSEETVIGVENTVPILLEKTFREQGAKFEAKEDFSENVVVDGNLITGQNPASSELIGKKLLEQLK